MGVTLAGFHSSGKITVSIDLAKITVIDGETMLTAILKLKVYLEYYLIQLIYSHLV